MLISIETNITCDFPGGGGVRTPYPPSGSAYDNVPVIFHTLTNDNLILSC